MVKRITNKELILAEIKKRGAVSQYDKSFVEWCSHIFTGKTSVEERIRIILHEMYRLGLIDRYRDSPKSSICHRYIYYLKED